jgi:excisionase family DNA binding protein
MTVAEVAETLNLNPHWINAGKLQAVRVDRRVRIKRADFDRLVEQSYTRSGSEATPSGIWEGEIQMPGSADGR